MSDCDHPSNDCHHIFGQTFCPRCGASWYGTDNNDRYSVPVSTATPEQLALVVQLSMMPVEMSGLAFNIGAATYAGLMGMAHAIHERVTYCSHGYPKEYAAECIGCYETGTFDEVADT